MSIRVFKRKVWKENKSWPEGFEPYGAARKTTILTLPDNEEGIAEARRICKDANDGRPTEGKGYYRFVWTEWETV